MLILICGIFLILSASLSIRAYKRLEIDSAVLFFGVWLGMFVLYTIDNNTVQLFPHDIGSYATRLFAESFMSFFIGTLAAGGLASFSKRPMTQQQASVIAYKQSNQWDLLFLWTKRLAIIYISMVIIKYALLIGRYGGNPLAYLYEIRIEKSLTLYERSFPVIFGFQNVVGNLVFLNLGPLLAISKKRSMRHLVILMMLFAYLDDATIADKGSIRLVLYLLFTWLTTSSFVGVRRFPIKTFVKLAIIFVLFFLLLSSITYLRVLPGWSSLAANSPWSMLVEGDNVVLFVTVVHLYNNLLGNIPSTAWMFDYPSDSVYPGDNTFVDIYRFLDTVARAIFGTGLYSEGYWIVKTVQYQAYLWGYGIFNTISHLGYYYSDFGEAGVIALSFLLGFFALYFHRKAVLSRRLADIQIAAMLMTAIVYTVRSVLYGGVNYWLTLLVIMIQYRMLARINRPLSASDENRAGIATAKRRSTMRSTM